MVQPLSIKTEPWSDFPRQSYSFISDDFCHDKNFVAKISAKTSRSVIKIKEALSRKGDKWSTADQVKLWFNLPNSGSFYTKIKSSDYIKVHYDHGVRQCHNKSYNLYATLNSDKLLSAIALKFGVGHDSQHCHTDNRLKLTLQQDKNQWHFYHKTIVNHGKFRFGLLAVADLTNSILQKNDILLGYRPDEKSEAFLRAQVKGFRKQKSKFNKPEAFFDTLTADYIRKVNPDTKVGLQAVYHLSSKKIGLAQLVVQRNLRAGEMIKVGVNHNADISLVHKRPVYGLQQMANLAIGINVSGLTQKQVHVRNGFQLGVNL